MARIGNVTIPSFIMLIIWILLVILLIILLAWVIHLIGGGSLDLHLGPFSFHIGVN